ncbi:MAG: preprotein translocase subunit SecY [candidate division SR1 bacterium]|nr:MAG: preprotein translocase subunit SecY [candidate division SR1 bacterium]
MKKFKKTLSSLWTNHSLRKKILFTVGILVLYRLLVFIPVPFANVELLHNAVSSTSNSGLGYFLMLLGGSLTKFSFIAIGLAPYINASIMMQLLGAVVPSLEKLTEEGEAGQQKISQYTRYLSVPLAFFQGIGMVYFMNYLLQQPVIPTDITTLLLAGFVMMVGGTMLMWLGELITEKGITNGISVLIFASIVSGITQSVYSSLSSASNFWAMLIFMLVIILGLIILSIFILKSLKEIPIIYARKGNVKESSTLPIPMNPVGMIPIIFAIAFVSFPYLAGKMIAQFQPGNEKLMAISNWTETHLNIYSQDPGLLAIFLYFVLIVLFTFFYSLITFSPDRMSDNIQKRGGFVPGIRPGKETANYINGVLMHLCLWGGIGLALIGIYSYLLYYIPFIQEIVQSVGGLPVVVTGSGVIIIVGVVQDIINKVQTDMIMQKYEKFDVDQVNKSLSEL